MFRLGSVNERFSVWRASRAEAVRLRVQTFSAKSGSEQRNGTYRDGRPSRWLGRRSYGYGSRVAQPRNEAPIDGRSGCVIVFANRIA
jgi:hypothetical protein